MLVLRSSETTPRDSRGEDPPCSGSELARLEGEVRGGVVAARWTPPDDFDPYDFGGWFHDPPGGDDALCYEPPRFRLEHGAAWAESGPPALRLGELRFLDAEGASGVALTLERELLEFEVREERAWLDQERPPEELEVLSVELLEAPLTVLPEPGTDGSEQ